MNRDKEYFELLERFRSVFDELLTEGPLPEYLRPDQQEVSESVRELCDRLMPSLLRGDRKGLRALSPEAISAGLDRAGSVENVSVPELEEARKRHLRELLEKARRKLEERDVNHRHRKTDSE